MTDGYIEHSSGLVKIINFRPINQPNELFLENAVGHIFVEIKTGLVVNYVDCIVYEHQVDSDGSPILSEIRLAHHIKYDLHDNVESCLFGLFSSGVLDKNPQITRYYVEDGNRALFIENWSDSASDMAKPDPEEVTKDGYSVPVPDEFFGYLLGKIAEVEIREGVFSDNWYLLRVCLFYFSRKGLTANDIFNIGYLTSQLVEKSRMEEDALKAQKAEQYRKRGTLANSLSAQSKRLQKDDVVIALRDEVKNSHGGSAVRIDSVAASYIRKLAKERGSRELMVSTKKEIISEATIRNRLSRLRKEGKIS